MIRKLAHPYLLLLLAAPNVLLADTILADTISGSVSVNPQQILSGTVVESVVNCADSSAICSASIVGSASVIDNFELVLPALNLPAGYSVLTASLTLDINGQVNGSGVTSQLQGEVVGAVDPQMGGGAGVGAAHLYGDATYTSVSSLAGSTGIMVTDSGTVDLIGLGFDTSLDANEAIDVFGSATFSVVLVPGFRLLQEQPSSIPRPPSGRFRCLTIRRIRRRPSLPARYFCCWAPG
jgi:hypothetical protein